MQEDQDNVKSASNINSSSISNGKYNYGFSEEATKMPYPQKGHVITGKSANEPEDSTEF